MIFDDAPDVAEVGLPTVPAQGDARFADGTPASAVLGGRVVVLANGRSGAGPAGVAACERLDASVRELGGSCEILRTGAALSMGEALERLRTIECDAMVAVGGDGTVAGVASVASARGVVFALLPAGTMNMVAKDLRLPLDPGLAAEQIRGWVVGRIDVAASNGHVFLHSSLLGLIPRLGRLRERVRASRSMRERLRWMALGVRAIGRTPMLHLTLRTGEHEQVFRTPALVVTNNPLSAANWLTHDREGLESGRLGVYASAHRGVFGRVMLLATLASGRLPADPHMIAGACDAFTVDAKRRTLIVSNDGEILHLQTPIRYESRPRGLIVLRPPEGAGS